MCPRTGLVGSLPGEDTPFIQKLMFLSLPADVLMAPGNVCSQPGGWQAVESDESGGICGTKAGTGSLGWCGTYLPLSVYYLEQA